MTIGEPTSATTGRSTYATSASPPFPDVVKVFTRIGLLSFGGPTAQIALMHQVIVDERGWLSEDQFLSALGFCMLLPGPEAMQLATYTGWRLHGMKGGLAAGLLFVLPGAILVLALAAIYAAFGEVPAVQAIFLGVKSAVLIIVMEALLRIAKRALKLRAAVSAADRRGGSGRLCAGRAAGRAGRGRFDAGRSAEQGRLWAHHDDGRNMAPDLVWPVGCHRLGLWSGSCALSTRRVFLQACGGHLWGRLCRSRLHGSGRGAGPWLAERR